MRDLTLITSEVLQSHMIPLHHYWSYLFPGKGKGCFSVLGELGSTSAVLVLKLIDSVIS